MNKNTWSDVYLWSLGAMFAVALMLTLAFNKPSEEELACSYNADRAEAVVVVDTSKLRSFYECYNG